MDHSDIEAALVEFVLKKGPEYVTLALLKKLPKDIKKQLGISDKSTASKFDEILQPFLGDRLVILRGGRSKYLVLNLPLDDMVLAAIRRKSGISPGRIAPYFPAKKSDFVDSLNRLLTAGLIRVELSNDYKAKALYPVDATDCSTVSTAPAAPVEQEPSSRPDDTAQFRDAYHALDRGRSYVRIHEIRRRLAWSREKFDRMLERLRDAATVQMHSGDITLMAEDEVADAYVDDNGFLHLTITWRGR